MQRKNIAAGNWKMNMLYADGIALAKQLVKGVSRTDVDVVIGVPYIFLNEVVSIFKGKENIKVAAQNCHQESKGAYTGEISAPQLKSLGVDCIILGHSERREYFGEGAALLAQKVDIVLANEMQPIFCCGENLTIREKGTHEATVTQQVKDSLFHLSTEQFSKVVIAYEPIWAIGTGKTASPAQAQEMHKAIRNIVLEKYGAGIANSTSILYGGSVKSANAQELFGQADVDGGLVGGASLKAPDFLDIIDAF